MSSIIPNKFDIALNVSNISANLKFLMKNSEIETAELSKATGIALTTINSLRKGAGNPTLSTLQLLSEFFNVSIGQLTEKDLSDALFKEITCEVPLLEVQDIDAFFSNELKCKNKIFIDVENKFFHYIAVKISNNAMAPHFEKGTVFVVCPDLKARDGDIVLVKFDNQLPCFRKIFIEGATNIFAPVSEIIGREITKNQNYTLQGVVTKAIQKFYD